MNIEERIEELQKDIWFFFFLTWLLILGLFILLTMVIEQ